MILSVRIVKQYASKKQVGIRQATPGKYPPLKTLRLNDKLFPATTFELILQALQGIPFAPGRQAGLLRPGGWVTQAQP